MAPEWVVADTREQVRDQPDSRLGQILGRLTQVRRPNPDVGVGNQDHVVLAEPSHGRQVLDLGVQAEGRGPHDQPGIAIRMLAHQLLHDRDRGVTRIGNAEEQLVHRIVKVEEAA